MLIINSLETEAIPFLSSAVSYRYLLMYVFCPFQNFSFVPLRSYSFFCVCVCNSKITLVLCERKTFCLLIHCNSLRWVSLRQVSLGNSVPVSHGVVGAQFWSHYLLCPRVCVRSKLESEVQLAFDPRPSVNLMQAFQTANNVFVRYPPEP